MLELIGWGLDEYEFRPPDIQPVAPPESVVGSHRSELDQVPSPWRQHLSPHRGRSDLHSEFAGLSWRLAIVDLRTLVAFQRRLRLTAAVPVSMPPAEDRAALTELAFGPPREITHRREDETTFVTDNPDLTMRATARGFELHGGSPFIEAAAYKGRLLLRDGYHRAYHLLQANVCCVPAVVIEAATLGDTGADAPWFFPEHVLLSPRPPLLTDFHDPALTVRYPRPHLRKTIRVHVEETFSPITTAL